MEMRNGVCMVIMNRMSESEIGYPQPSILLKNIFKQDNGSETKRKLVLDNLMLKI